LATEQRAVGFEFSFYLIFSISFSVLTVLIIKSSVYCISFIFF